MKKLLLISALVLFQHIGLGQNYDFSKITVNGLELFKPYSNNQIFTALGQPTRTTGPELGDIYSDSYSYRYGNMARDDVFEFVSGTFESFTIRTSSYSLNNFIRVGDSIDKLSLMGGFITSEGNIKYWKPNTSNRAYSEISVLFRYSNNVIVAISLISPM